MKPKHQRALLLVAALGCISVGVAGLLSTFRDNIVFFFSPTEVMEKNIPSDKRIRVGGLVVGGSVKKHGDKIEFDITDNANTIHITYEGLPPNLFREGIGIVAEGYLTEKRFAAENLLAKHDENYMPPEVAKALKDAGHWKEQYGNDGGSK